MNRILDSLQKFVNNWYTTNSLLGPTDKLTNKESLFLDEIGNLVQIGQDNYGDCTCEEVTESHLCPSVTGYCDCCPYHTNICYQETA